MCGVVYYSGHAARWKKNTHKIAVTEHDQGIFLLI